MSEHKLLQQVSPNNSKPMSYPSFLQDCALINTVPWNLVFKEKDIVSKFIILVVTVRYNTLYNLKLFYFAYRINQSRGLIVLEQRWYSTPPCHHTRTVA